MRSFGEDVRAVADAINRDASAHSVLRVAVLPECTESDARTLVAGITTEIVHDAADTFLLITSRSFAGSLWHAIDFAAEEWVD